MNEMYDLGNKKSPSDTKYCFLLHHFIDKKGQRSLPMPVHYHLAKKEIDLSFMTRDSSKDYLKILTKIGTVVLRHCVKYNRSFLLPYFNHVIEVVVRDYNKKLYSMKRKLVIPKTGKELGGFLVLKCKAFMSGVDSCYRLKYNQHIDLYINNYMKENINSLDKYNKEKC